MYRNPIITGLTLSTVQHGATAFYAHAPAIPPAHANVPIDSFGNGGWIPAPNGSTIGFGNGGASRLPGGSCFRALDFTFFQTLVDIPAGTTLTAFTITFAGMDDGSRVSIFNSAHPGGIVVPGSYVFLGGSGTTNLKDYVVAGETNRVVITQVDDCPVGNSLQVANVVLNGQVVQAATTVPPTFSIPSAAPPGACICTPLLMNTDLNGKQSWWVKAQGGPLTITAIAHAVNSVDPEKVVAQVYSWPGNAPIGAPLVAEYPAGTPSGSEASASTTIPAAAGDLFRVEVSTPPPTVGTQPHFRLSASNAEVIGTASPSTPSFEHEELTWHFNVGSGENLNVAVQLANPPDPAVTVGYDLFDPSGALHASGTVSAPGSINVAGASPGTWALRVHPSAHYTLSKTSGADRGIYVAWDSTGSGTLQAVADDAAPGAPYFTDGPVEFVIYNSDSVEVGRQLTATGVANFGKLPSGMYTVHIISATPGFTALAPTIVEVAVICDQPAVANFVVADITPPVIDPLPDLTYEAGPGGAAVATWTAAANDLGRGAVPVYCVPTSGSMFTLGTETVTCTAVDAAGNPAAPVSFTVTVQDTVAPSAACTPSYNPSTKNVPRASRRNEDGFYLVAGSDTAGPVTITVGSYTLQQGETVKFTQSPGTNGAVFVNNQGREPVRHFRVGPGDPVITVTDASGNATTQTCYVPPIPK